MSFLKKHFPLRLHSDKEEVSSNDKPLKKTRYFLRKKDANRLEEPNTSASKRSKFFKPEIGNFSKHNSQDLRDVGCEEDSYTITQKSHSRIFFKKSETNSLNQSKPSHVTFSSDTSCSSGSSVTNKVIKKTPGVRRGRQLETIATCSETTALDENYVNFWDCQTIVPISKCQNVKPSNCEQQNSQNEMESLTKSMHNISVEKEKMDIAADVHATKQVILRPFHKLQDVAPDERLSNVPYPIVNPCRTDLRKLDGRDKDDEPYALDHYEYLLSYEKVTQVQPNFLAASYLSVQSRATLNNWLIKVQLYLHNTTESLHMTVALCDYFLSLNRISHRHYQLLVITAYFISVKIVERYPPSLKKLCYLTEDQYKESEVLSFETLILHHIKYRALLVTPVQLLDHMIRGCADLDDSQFRRLILFCRYLFDLLLVDKLSADLLPSVRAAAALLYGRAVLFPSLSKWNSTMQNYTGYTEDDLLLCSAMYSQLVHDANKNTSLTAAFEKYKDPRYDVISQCPEISASNFMLPE